MKYCAHCGQQLQDDAQFCEKCGASTTTEAAQFAKEKGFLDDTHRFLKYERLSWKIIGIIMLVLSALFFFFTLLVFAGAAGMVVDAETESALGLGLVALMMVIYGLVFLPFAIIGLVCAKKISGYMNELYNDIRPTAKRCSSVGMIVLSALFNEFALIFYIINFARFKSNKELVERISARQIGQ